MESKNKFMLRAIELSVKSANGTGGPFGCVVVKNNKIIAEGSNNVTFLNDPTAHAEILAIRKTCKELKSSKLFGYSIYVTLQPCEMCLHAILNARISRLYYGASDLENISLQKVYNTISVSYTHLTLPTTPYV